MNIDNIAKVLINNDFPFMILLGDLILTLHFPKRKYWYIAIPFLVLPFLLILVDTGNNLVYGILKFFGIFVLTFIPLVLYVKADVWSYIYVGTISYCNQHIAQRLSILIRIFYQDYISSQVLNFFVEFILMLLILLFMYIGFVRKTPKNSLPILNDKSQLIIGLFVLLVTVILSLISIVKSGGLEDKTLNIVTIIFSIICCFAAIGLEMSQSKLKQAEIDNQILNQIIHESQNQYRNSAKSIEQINIKCHDLKHLLNNINSKITQEEAMQLKKQIDIYDHSYQTGSKALDVVLTEKAIHCIENNIRFTALIDGKIFSKIKDSDIYSIFENAISNAIKSVQDLEEDYRVISLTQEEDTCFYKIICKNYFKGEIDFNDKHLPLSKSKSIYHGYGIKSMVYLLEKYNGSVKFETNNNMFILTFYIPKN